MGDDLCLDTWELKLLRGFCHCKTHSLRRVKKGLLPETTTVDPPFVSLFAVWKYSAYAFGVSVLRRFRIC